MNIQKRHEIVAYLLTLLCALCLFGCSDRKQADNASPQQPSKQVNDANSQQSAKQVKEAKSQVIGNAVKVKKLTPQPVTVQKDRIAGKYVNSKNPSITLEISNDGTYLYTVNTSYIGGNYVLDGDKIALLGPGKPFEGKIEGGAIVGGKGVKFVKSR